MSVFAWEFPEKRLHIVDLRPQLHKSSHSWNNIFSIQTHKFPSGIFGVSVLEVTLPQRKDET